MLHMPNITQAQVDALPEIKAALVAPAANRAWVMGEIARLAAHTWQPDRPMEQQRVLVSDYLDELAQEPAYALEIAFRECRRKSRFFPKLADILDEVRKADRFRLGAEHAVRMLEVRARYQGLQA